jgi:hypothetical protein
MGLLAERKNQLRMVFKLAVEPSGARFLGADAEK